MEQMPNGLIVTFFVIGLLGVCFSLVWIVRELNRSVDEEHVTIRAFALVIYAASTIMSTLFFTEILYRTFY